MIITANLNPDQARNINLGMRRIFDRLIERCKSVVVDGESRRKAL